MSASKFIKPIVLSFSFFSFSLASLPIFAEPLDPKGEQILNKKTNGKASYKHSVPKKSVSMVSVGKGSDLMPETKGQSNNDKSLSFLKTHGSIFGVMNTDKEVKLLKSRKDALGFTTNTYQQEHNGIPVLGGQIKTHFDRTGKLFSTSSTFIPNITLNTAPTISANTAENTAQTALEKDKGPITNPQIASKLIIFNTGVTNNIQGTNHLTYQVNIKGTSTQGQVNEVILVDAHSNLIVTQYSNIHEALNRRVYDLQGDPLKNDSFFNKIYPEAPFWVEGAPFPTNDPEANLVIPYTKWTYDLYFKVFNRDAPDYMGSPMDNVVNWDVNQFNAFNICDDETFNGVSTDGQLSVFSVGLVTDDIVAHEWSHCYHTYSTGGFVYENQSGAIGESFADIVGEVVDIPNVDAANFPVEETLQPTRFSALNEERCTIVSPISGTSPIPNILVINSPASIASQHWGGAATFGPAMPAGGVTGQVVFIDDKTAGCQQKIKGVKGKIALINRGACPVPQQVKNAQNDGAIAVLIADTVPYNGRLTIGGADKSITIPSMGVTYEVGTKLRSATNSSVTLKPGPTQNLEESYRWLQSEEPLAGIVRDLWNPHCDVDPAKVSDTDFYICSANDDGGVHRNSTILSHAFALVVDGGSFNGQQIGSIGLDKAFPIFYRALDSYNTPTTNFPEYADNLTQACQDLIGEQTISVTTFLPGASITSQDCDQLEKAITSVELRQTPECFQ